MKGVTIKNPKIIFHGMYSVTSQPYINVC